MKKIVSIILILCILLSAVSVYADDVSDYMDYDSLARKMVSKRLPDDYTKIDGSESQFKKLTAGWYIVENSCTIGNAPLAPFTAGGVGIVGDVHIIIGDGVTLTVLGGFGLEKYEGAKGKLFIHGVQYGDCNLVVQGIAPNKKLAVDEINFAYGQGLDIYEFSVYGCNVTITAADGAQGVAPLDADGKDGYAAVQQTQMDIYNSVVKVYGGNGGDSGTKRSFQGTNNGGDGGYALLLSSVDLRSGTLELYGGNGGKHLIGSGGNGVPGDSEHGTSIHAANATVRDAQTQEIINLDDISDHQSVIITSPNLATASIIGNGLPMIIILGLIILGIVVLVLRKTSRKNKKLKA